MNRLEPVGKHNAMRLPLFYHTILALCAAPLACPARERLRELSTDRPDQTESPFTVDRGHWQVEISPVAWTRIDSDTSALSLGSVNLKYGITDFADAQLLWDSWQRSRGPDGRDETYFESLTLRGKFNLFGNDGGKTACAVMPYVTLPTTGGLNDGRLDAGLILPWSVELDESVGLGAMVEIDWLGSEGSEWQAFLTGTLSVSLTERWSVYGELAATVPLTGGGTGWQGDFGAVFALSERSAVDAGCNLGLNDRAPDRELFLGYSVKF